MIGQKKLLNKIKSQIQNNKIPTFIILTGIKGSGKTTLIKELFPSAVYSDGISVDDIRKIIELGYKLSNQVFVILNADDMSNNAKNSMLKLVEEGRNDNKFILTLQDEFNTLDTIRSRAAIYHMETYTSKEIEEYVRQYMPIPTEQEDEFVSLFTDLCDTPGEVQLLASMNAEDFYKYVEKVVDNISEVSGSNSFKIANEIALKNEEDKYDLVLFWKAFMQICREKKTFEHYRWIHITSEYLRKLKIRGVNKQMLFDTWILDIRKVSLNERS